MKRKLLSTFLAFCMMLTLVPTAALAVDDTFVPTEEELIAAEKYQQAFKAEDGKTWENLGNAALNYNYAKTYVENLKEGDAKTAAQKRLEALTTYYESITELDMSGKKGGYGGDEGRHGCLTVLTNLEKLNLKDTGITNVGPLQKLTKLKEVNISNNPITDLGALVGLTELTKLDAANTKVDSNDFGALVNKKLTYLDLSGTNITFIGPITTNGNSPACADTLAYLDVSNTGLTQLQEVWNGAKKTASLPQLKTLHAKGLSLTSISGLVEIANSDDFSDDGVTWDLSGSTLSGKDEANHIGQISAKFASGGFTAPVAQKDDNKAEYSLAKAEQWKHTIETQMGDDNGKANLTWQALIFGHYWFDTAKEEIEKLSSDKTALTSRWNVIDTYYKSITAMDMSNKTEVPEGYAKSVDVFSIFPNLTKLDISNTGLSDFGIGNSGANLVKLEDLNLSGLSCTSANTLFGGLSGLDSLKVLNISNIEGVTDIGGLVGAGVADTITTLDISNTKVTKLESVWATENKFPALKTLTAHGLELESISGLAEIAGAEGFDPSGITWDFGVENAQSTVKDDGSSLAPVHVVLIQQAFAGATDGKFVAPKTGASAVYSAIKFQEKVTETLDKVGTGLSWDTLITAKYWRITAEEYIKNLTEGTAKTALVNLMTKVDEAYAKITSLDMSGKTESKYDISTDAVNLFPNLTELNLSGTGISDTGGLAVLKQLESLDLSNNAGITDANLGALKGMDKLTTLNLSRTGISDVGGLVANEVADTITTLDISETKVTKLESVWDADNKTSAFPELKTLTAKKLNLTSISGLVEIATAPGFASDGITWNLDDSTLTDNKTNQEHVKGLASVLTSGFTAPTIKDDSSTGGGSTGGGGSSGGGSSSGGGGGGGGAVVTKYTLTFDTNGGSAIAKVTKDKGTKVDLSGYTTTRQGYTFAGWYADKALTDKVTSVTLNSNQTVYAKWTEKTPEKPALPFTDVTKGDWFYDAVQYVYDKGMMNGVDGGRFAPNAATSRAMIVTILYRLENEPGVSGKSPFTDVAAGQWYTNAVAWAAANGIVTGTTDTTFAPNGNITREQMAAILYRYASYKGLDVSRQADLSGYADASAISAYAKQAMAWANGQGLITGVTATTLNPGGNAVRAQAATILMRLCEQVL